MKLQNPILITLNNTLHIKADNLEPVEVDSSCVDEFRNLAHVEWLNTECSLTFGEYLRRNKINISELSDRIEVKHTWLDSCGDKPKAFLIPLKEKGSTIINGTPQWLTDPTKVKAEITFEKSYTIEEIEKAIDSLGKNWKMPKIKEAIINNLKK